MNKRLLDIDFLKIIAMFSIVLLHVSVNLFYSYNTINNYWWWLGNIICSTFRWGVPVFIIVSGAMLLNPDKSKERISEFFKKRFNRILIPLISWTIIYTLWTYSKNQTTLNTESINQTLANIFQGRIYNFLYYLMGLYLITPILRKYLKQADKKNIQYFLVLWVIANFIYPIISRIFNITMGVPLYLSTGFIGYYLIGFYIYNFDITLFQKKTIYVLGFLGLFLTILGTFLLTRNSGVPDEWFYEYLHPNVVFPSVGIVIFIKDLNWNLISNNKQNIAKLIIKISGTSLGLYLLHPIILELLAIKGINSLLINPIVGIPLTFLLATTISLFIILLIQKIPIIKKIV